MAKLLKSRQFLLVIAVLGCLVLMLSFGSRNTRAWLKDEAQTVTNEMSKGQVSCTVRQDYDRTLHQVSAVRVENTGDSPAYLRARLVSYRQNIKGQTIGGTEHLPAFTPDSGWVKHTDGYYYYTLPVAPGQSTQQLIRRLDLAMDASGSQVLEVLAEAIQSFPAEAHTEAWGVRLSPGQVVTLDN